LRPVENLFSNSFQLNLGCAQLCKNKVLTIIKKVDLFILAVLVLLPIAILSVDIGYIRLLGILC
jgi:hypothetical protein